MFPEIETIDGSDETKVHAPSEFEVGAFSV